MVDYRLSTWFHSISHIKLSIFPLILFYQYLYFLVLDAVFTNPLSRVKPAIVNAKIHAVRVKLNDAFTINLINYM